MILNDLPSDILTLLWKKSLEHHLLCQNLFPAGRVLNNLAKSASKEYLKENHILQCAAEMSSLLDNNTCDQVTMKYTEGVLMETCVFA